MFARLMGLKTIAPAELAKLLHDPEKLCTIDLNSEQSWTRARVPGAHHVLAANLAAADLPGDRSKLLVFYCSNLMCRKAPNAARIAERAGYGNVRVMSAGISGWLSAGLPIESGRTA